MSGPGPGGLFVVFEGGDGVGKSTQQKLLGERLAAAGIAYLPTRQPGGTAIGSGIRTILLDPATGDLAPKAEALLYAADKAQHVHQVVRPALAAEQVVVCDRYIDSLLAYQGAGRVLSTTEVAQVSDWATDGLHPDLTVLLDLDPAEGVADIVAKDRIEAAGVDFHQRVRDGFLALAAADPDRYLVLAAREPREQIAAAVWSRVRELLSDRGGTVAP